MKFFFSPGSTCNSGRWAAAASLVLGAGSLSAQAEPAFRGVSYAGFTQNGLASEQSRLSVTAMQQVGIDTVAVNVVWFQDNANSSTIAQDFSRYSASTASVVSAIRDIQGRGMKVLLKPMVDLRDGGWRGTIAPSDQWFTSYSQFINGWAAIAESENVALFSAGNEYSATQSWSSQWRGVIDGVRQRYNGPVVYGANWDAYQSVNWWDATDYVGLSAYFPISSNTAPTSAQLNTAWSTIKNDIGDWRELANINQQVLFTEAGYRSGDGATIAPYNYLSPLDEDAGEQADAYRALLSAMWQETWFDGAFWWNWETNPLAGGTGTGYTPQNKPAEDVLREFYLVPEPTAVSVFLLGTFWAMKRPRRTRSREHIIKL